MKAKDVMVTNVVTVGPDATVAEIATLMNEHRISAVPVVRADALIGIVSEGDLVRRHEIGSDEARESWWLRIFGGEGSSAAEYIQSRAKKAVDVMTRDPVTVEENTPLSEIARIFERRHIKRVPVVRGKKIVGLVSRANLVQALASTSSPTEAVPAGDEAIRAKLIAELEKQPWWSSWTGNVVVSDGVVQFWGFYRAQGERDAARVAAENIPGVKEVQDNRIHYNAVMGAG
jgi:CBS domain-containing protein